MTNTDIDLLYAVACQGELPIMEQPDTLKIKLHRYQKQVR
jgi:hypothetical protein